jgi:hypothetical protein
MRIGCCYACFLVWVCCSVLLTAQVPAQHSSQRPPDAYYKRLGDDPGAFTFQHSFLALTLRIRENNFMVSYAMPGMGMAVAELNGGITISGTKLLRILLATSTDSPQPPYTSESVEKAYFYGNGIAGTIPTGTLNDFYAAMSYGNLTGRTIPVAMNAVTAVVPPPATNANAPHTPALSGLLNKSVTVTGNIETRNVFAPGNTVVLHITNVQSLP